MVRPKASDTNKLIARTFADTVTVEISEPHKQKQRLRKSHLAVDRTGQMSIYQALTLCVPNIIREVKDQGITNRKGLAELELN